MLFYCAYTWHTTTRPETVWERLIHQHERGDNAPELIRGWYDFAGGGAGFLIVETDDVRELTSMLRPYIDLMTWDIRALSENPYQQTIQQVRDQLAQMDPASADARVSPGREES
ncbi:MAG: DUF3303 family protein [Thermomicrobiales bacterium]